jgi:hypothetical protein
MKVFALKVSVVLFVSLIVVCFFVIIQPTSPVKTTLGALSEKSSDFSGQRVVISNAILGQRSGRFIWFRAGVDHRHDVVFALRTAEVEADCTTFRGYCFGVMEERIPECPHDPPFLYVMGVEPIRPDP